MQGHGEEKFKDAGLLATSVHRPWSTISAELRSHVAGEIGSFVPQNAEITMILRSSTSAVTSRSSGGVTQVVPAFPNTTWLCPAGICEEATRLSDDISEVLHVYLPQRAFTGIRENDGLEFQAQDLRYQARVENPRVMEMLASIIGELRSESFAGGLRMDALAVSLVRTLAVEHAEMPVTTILPFVHGGLDRRRLARVIEYIEDNLENDISVVELASVASFSLYHFARAFHVSTGRSPHAYVAERRIDMAKHLLAYSGVPLSTIAASCRFSSQSNFSKAFQNATGYSPGRYRLTAIA